MVEDRSLTVFTVGHNNRQLDDFIKLLKTFKVALLVDIRRIPTSRWEWFRKENLENKLREEGVGYLWLGEALGGFRRGGYPAYMKTDAFQQGIRTLLTAAHNTTIAIMCAERIVFRCHRRHIARHLKSLGVRVIHIVNDDNSFE